MSDKRVPVILDTDIGGDIDDTWALALLLKSPEVDLKLVVGDTHDTVYRAKLAAKILTIAGRTDIPVGIGTRQSGTRGAQEPWVEGYDLGAYRGTIHEDGVGAIIDTIMAPRSPPETGMAVAEGDLATSPEPVTLLCIGPVPNIAAALAREPRIAAKARFVGMHGSVRRGYGGSPQVSAEYNVAADPQSCRAVFAAPWQEMLITPLDTCGLVALKGDKYLRVRDCPDPLTAAVIENYRIWSANGGHDPGAAEERSSVLFDAVAAYLTFSQQLVVVEEVGLRVTDDGYTRLDDRAKRIECATAWTDLGTFEDLLVERLAGR